MDGFGISWMKFSGLTALRETKDAPSLLSNTDLNKTDAYDS